MREQTGEEPKYIIVIGASAGGLNSVIELMAGVTEETDAAVLVVFHASNSAFIDAVVQRLQKNPSSPANLPNTMNSLKQGISTSLCPTSTCW